MKSIYAIFFFILFVLGPSECSFAQPSSPTAMLSVSSSAPVNPGGTTSISVLLAPAIEGADAFSFGLMHNPNVLSVSPVAGSFFDALTPLFITIDQATGGVNQAGFTMAVVLDQDEIVEVPVGSHEVAAATYTAFSNAAPGSYPVTFVNFLVPNSSTANPPFPPVITEVVSNGMTLVAGAGLTTEQGMIVVELVSFIRGDANMSGTITLIDVIFLLRFITGSALPFPNTCQEVYDINGSGTFETLGDPMYLLSYMFTGGTAPPPPFPTCGTPSQYQHSCSSFSFCP